MSNSITQIVAVVAAISILSNAFADELIEINSDGQNAIAIDKELLIYTSKESGKILLHDCDLKGMCKSRRSQLLFDSADDLDVSDIHVINDKFLFLFGDGEVNILAEADRSCLNKSSCLNKVKLFENITGFNLVYREIDGKLFVANEDGLQEVISTQGGYQDGSYYVQGRAYQQYAWGGNYLYFDNPDNHGIWRMGHDKVPVKLCDSHPISIRPLGDNRIIFVDYIDSFSQKVVLGNCVDGTRVLYSSRNNREIDSVFVSNDGKGVIKLKKVNGGYQILIKESILK